ncbi:hypothetical protein KQX54_015753 [Cotesia glomerata]|uniref:Uncharacterized protein n=1 Tax=Cotesia glomerata TaxID=32391 RepID=A0AAV7IJQ9_COTGL|nr:hypothetical protein KQX54_015753 [Cotesia glomerata]
MSKLLLVAFLIALFALGAYGICAERGERCVHGDHCCSNWCVNSKCDVDPRTHDEGGLVERVARIGFGRK